MTVPRDRQPPGRVVFDLDEALKLLAAVEGARDVLTETAFSVRRVARGRSGAVMRCAAGHTGPGRPGRFGWVWPDWYPSAEVAMPVIVVTRLRLRDPALLEEFFTAAIAVHEQARDSPGNLGADVLGDANNVYWTATAWHDRGAMDAFVGSEPHLATMNHIDDWCDEATFADWQQADPDLPDWQAGYRMLVADGQSAKLTHASAAHQTRGFPPPVDGS